MKLMILDGNSVVNRAFYGVKLLSTHDGIYTNAIFGFLNILEKLRAEEVPDALCVAFDLKAPTFRHLQYAGYKATRHPMPEELCMQMPYLKDVLRAMRIPIYECEGWEADDVIGTVGKDCENSGWDCVIVTGDRDSLQLVSSRVHVKLVTSKMGQTLTTLYDEETFREEYGFEPKRLIDLKSLMGDSSDNIPGVAGVGPKTATELLLQFGSLDEIYQNLDGIKESVRKKLESSRDMAYLSYDLATIRCSAPIAFTPEKNLVQEPDGPALYELFTKLEFVRLIDRYHLHSVREERPETVEGTCVSETICSMARARELFSSFAAEPFVCVLASPDLSSFAVEGCGQMSLFSRDVLGEDYFAAMREFFGGRIKKATHDCKSLCRALLERNVEPASFEFDTAVAAYLLDATAGGYELEKLTVQYLGFELPKPPDGASEQAAALSVLFSRTAAVRALHDTLAEKLRQEGMDALYSGIDLPLCAVLADMEHTGVLVDQLALISFGNMLSGRINACQQTIFDIAGGEFNINSTKQLGDLLFEKLKLPAGKKTKNGYSTNADVLERLRGRHPIIDAILDYRTLTKLKSTYSDGLVKQIADDGRIHTSFQNTVTATGRLSSTEPNLQNIPVRTELGSEIRKMFVPKDGCIFVDADYSQIELRVLAHIADDKRMQQAFLSGMDIHTATASQVFGVAPENVTPLMRRHAKAVNFGIVYGISEFSLSEDIGVTRREARDYIDHYLENYSGVRQYMKDIVEKAKADGYVTTLFGRRRYLPELKSSNFNLRSFGERVALNTPIQGTAADIIKIAMLHVSEALKQQKLHAKLLLQVHDELIVECPVEEAEKVTKLVTEQMQNVVQLRAPLIAEAKQGTSWYEAK